MPIEYTGNVHREPVKEVLQEPNGKWPKAHSTHGKKLRQNNESENTLPYGRERPSGGRGYTEPSIRNVQQKSHTESIVTQYRHTE